MLNNTVIKLLILLQPPELHIAARTHVFIGIKLNLSLDNCIISESEFDILDSYNC